MDKKIAEITVDGNGHIDFSVFSAVAGQLSERQLVQVMKVVSTLKTRISQAYETSKRQ